MAVTEHDLLRQCAASGQMTAAQVYEHHRAGEMRDERMVALAIRISDESCRSLIECHTLQVPSNHPMPVYDLSTVDLGDITDEDLLASIGESVNEAVRYLDMRELLVRPVPGAPHLVAFMGAAHG